MPSPYQISLLNIDASTWTPIIAPFSCSVIGIKNIFNLANILIKTDSDSDVILPGYQEIIGMPYDRLSIRAERFLNGSIVCYLQSSFGSGNCVVRFLA